MGQIEELDDEEQVPNLPYKICKCPELGRYLEAAKDLKKGDVLWRESPLVIGPVSITPPICLCCYVPVDGSYL